MKEGSFRVDLFYRLKVVSIYLPPLRERRSDIPILIDHFMNKYMGQLKLSQKKISKKAMQLLGNVRELENNIHTAMVMSKSDTLQPEDFPIFAEGNKSIDFDMDVLQEDYTETFKKIIDPIMPKLISGSPGQIYQFLESAFERAIISSCLKHFEGNQVKTSETLGISRNTLRDRISRYDIY